MTTETTTPTIRINGRDYQVTIKDADFVNTRQAWGEVILTGPRGARYLSARNLTTDTFTFWNTNTRHGLAAPMFDHTRFVIEDGAVRAAVYGDFN